MRKCVPHSWVPPSDSYVDPPSTAPACGMQEQSHHYVGASNYYPAHSRCYACLQTRMSTALISTLAARANARIFGGTRHGSVQVVRGQVSTANINSTPCRDINMPTRVQECPADMLEDVSRLHALGVYPRVPHPTSLERVATKARQQVDQFQDGGGEDLVRQQDPH